MIEAKGIDSDIKAYELYRWYRIIQSKKSALDAAFDVVNARMNKGERIPRDELAAFQLVLDDFRNQFFMMEAENAYSGRKFPHDAGTWKSVRGISQKLEEEK